MPAWEVTLTPRTQLPLVIVLDRGRATQRLFLPVVVVAGAARLADCDRGLLEGLLVAALRGGGEARNRLHQAVVLRLEVRHVGPDAFAGSGLEPGGLARIHRERVRDHRRERFESRRVLLHER